MKFMNSVSPSRSRSGPQGSSSETSGSVEGFGGELTADAGGAAAATSSSGKGSAGAEDSSGGGVTGGAADSIGGSDCGAASMASAEGSAGVSAGAESKGSAGGDETVDVGAAEASGGERSFIALCPVREARQAKRYAILASQPKARERRSRRVTQSDRGPVREGPCQHVGEANRGGQADLQKAK